MTRVGPAASLPRLGSLLYNVLAQAWLGLKVLEKFWLEVAQLKNGSKFSGSKLGSARGE